MSYASIFTQFSEKEMEFEEEKDIITDIIVLNIFFLKLVIRRKSLYLPDMKETIWNK